MPMLEEMQDAKAYPLRRVRKPITEAEYAKLMREETHKEMRNHGMTPGAKPRNMPSHSSAESKAMTVKAFIAKNPGLTTSQARLALRLTRNEFLDRIAFLRVRNLIHIKPRKGNRGEPTYFVSAAAMKEFQG